MKLAVLSGKGGTGKTFVSTNMAYVAAQNVSADSGAVTYIDCDVEAPNGSLFLLPEGASMADPREVSVLVPSIAQDACTGCRACTDFCAFGALAFVMNAPLVFQGMCHSCGGCARVCPTHAITEIARPVGTIQSYERPGLMAYEGRMNVGETSGMPVISELLTQGDNKGLTIVDCPPGTACAAAACVSSADMCVIVAEPSAFGAHNMAMAYDLVTFFGKPCVVVLNKVQEGVNHSRDYCTQHDIPVALEIPFTRERAAQVSQGQLVAEIDDVLREGLEQFMERITAAVQDQGQVMA